MISNIQKPKIGDEFELIIEDIAFGGKGISTYNNFKIFVTRFFFIYLGKTTTLSKGTTIGSIPSPALIPHA